MQIALDQHPQAAIDLQSHLPALGEQLFGLPFVGPGLLEQHERRGSRPLAAMDQDLLSSPSMAIHEIADGRDTLMCQR